MVGGRDRTNLACQGFPTGERRAIIPLRLFLRTCSTPVLEVAFMVSRRCPVPSQAANRVIVDDCLKALRGLPEGSCDLVFADPPYAFSAYEELLAGIGLLLNAEGTLAIEHSTRSSLSDSRQSLVAVDRREYGESTLTFFQKR